jgi:hypothetical protein
MARRRKGGLRILNTLAMPAVLCGFVFAAVANKPYEAGIVGVMVGLVIGICILAFPDLDRGGPADDDSFIH